MDAPKNPVKVMIGYEYNEAHELAYEVINRARTIIVRCPDGKLTFSASVSNNGVVAIDKG